MAAEYPDEAVRIRNLWPIVKTHPELWKEVVALARQGDKAGIQKAEDLARDHTNSSPRLRAIHVGAIAKRAMRRRFLEQQKSDEKITRDALITLADRADTIINRESREGKVPESRYRVAVDALSERNKEAYAAIASGFQTAIRNSVKVGLQHSMANAEAVVRHARRSKESSIIIIDVDELISLTETDPLKQQLTYSMSDSVFKKLFKGALRDTMEAGLFGKGKRVSSRVWDLRGQNMASMKRILAAGITAGDDPATISRAIRGILVQPKTLRGNARAAATPGAGIYRSAYANAMRLTRTETNRAYVLSDTIFAESKSWNLIWQVSTGQREEDECLRQGTLIQTRNGEVEIERIRPGDFVLTHKNKWRCVTKTFKNKTQDGSLIRLRFQEGKNHNREIFCTPNHPILIDGKWIQAGDLKTGCLGTSTPLSRFGRAVHISSDDSDTKQPGFARSSTPVPRLIEKEIIRTSDAFVYNLAVEGDNSYFANGIAVHNCDNLGGREMTPEDFAKKYPVHAQCLCYSILAPRTKFESKMEDTPAELD